MAFHIRDEATDTLARKLARRTGKGLTETVRLALEAELRRRDDDLARRQAELDAILARLDATPRTGLKADKAFFDEISGD